MLDFLSKTYSKDFYIKAIFASIFVLCSIGLASIYSSTSAANIDAGLFPLSDTLFQVGAIAVGIFLAFLLSKAPQVFNWNKIAIWTAWGICCAFVVAVLFIGIEVNGAKRWLKIPFTPLQIQPSEFMKIAMLAMAVKILVEYKRGEQTSSLALIKFGGFCIFPLVFMFVTQRDLGTTLICVGALFTVAYIAGIRGEYLVGILVIMGVGILIYLNIGGDYRSQRMNFLNPWDDGQGGYGSGYNLIRAFYAIATGGVFGVGLGNSHEKYDYLYAADNDFIFAIICEEGGLLFGLVVIACVCCIFYSACKLAQLMPSEEQKLLVYGIGFLIFFQSFLNIGCSVGALPTTGKPLPFVSSGGTSVVASFILLGLILNASNAEPVRTTAERRRDDLEVLSRAGTSRDRTQRPSFTNLQPTRLTGIRSRKFESTRVRRGDRFQ